MVNVAILGYGTIGSGVAQIIDENNSILAERIGDGIGVKSILDLRDFPGDKNEKKVTKNIDDIVSDEDVAVSVFYPVTISEDRLTDMSEFITRINCEYLIYAQFSLVYDLGMLMATYHFDIRGENIFSEEQAEKMVYSVLWAMDDYADDLFLVANAGVSGNEQFLKVKEREEELERRAQAGEDDDEDEDGTDGKRERIKFYIKL